MHVGIDDASRVAFVQVMPDQRSAVPFLEAAIAYLAKLGVQVERVMTDNGSCYRSKAFRAACKRLGLYVKSSLSHTRQKPMAKPSASFRLLYASGLMLGLTTPPTNDPPNCPTGFIATTGIGPTYQPPRSTRGQPVEAPQLAQPGASVQVLNRGLRFRLPKARPKEAANRLCSLNAETRVPPD